MCPLINYISFIMSYLLLYVELYRCEESRITHVALIITATKHGRSPKNNKQPILDTF